MTNSPRDTNPFGWAAPTTAFVLGLLATACTPATADPTASGSGGQGDGRSGGAIGAMGTGGSGGAAVLGSGGSPGSGGATVGGSGGAIGSGGAVGPTTSTGGQSTTATGGSTGAAGAPVLAATGCNWVNDTATNTWKFNPPAEDKIVLFDGTTLDGWHKLNSTQPVSWKLIGDGTMEVVPAGTAATQIQSNMKFDDVCVHVEYLTPVYNSGDTNVQNHGNSGVYLKSAYEMQILDTTNMPPINDGCGAIYKISAPLVTACNKFQVWNTYEIDFKSSVWSGNTKTKLAVFAQVALNGIIVQKNVAVDPGMTGSTAAGIPDAPGPQPLGLQDHLQLVRFRNIWVTIPRR